jgi:hypothetical protein
VNINTTDATTGATGTALLLPAQNTHTLHDPIRDTEHARAGQWVGTTSRGPTGGARSLVGQLDYERGGSKAVK